MFSFLISYIAPAFIVTSPVTSYADQIWSIHINKSSRGFSLDTPLIMLIASVLRCFYWLGAEFETSLLLQSFVMIAVQLVLLKIALDNRSPENTPFSTYNSKERPYDFWQWRSQKPYWEFLFCFLLFITLLQFFFGSFQFFVNVMGCLALGIEATLPIPQLFQNARTRTCQGFRLSVLASWILGDFMKQVYFFSAEHIQVQFKVCAIFQMILDIFLCWQFYAYGSSTRGSGSTSGGSSGNVLAEKMGGFVVPTHHYHHPSLSEKIEIQHMNGSLRM